MQHYDGQTPGMVTLIRTGGAVFSSTVGDSHPSSQLSRSVYIVAEPTRTSTKAYGRKYPPACPETLITDAVLGHSGRPVCMDRLRRTRAELGKLFRGLRCRRGLTVDEVAKDLVWSPAKFSRIETRGGSCL